MNPNDTQEPRSASLPADNGVASTSSGWRPPKLEWTTITLSIGLAGAGMLMVLWAWNLWPFTSAVERTDDAYVRGKITVISPQVSGYVTEVLVNDYDTVTHGQILATIDNRVYLARVSQMQASLDAAVANLANSEQSERARRAAYTGSEAGLAIAGALLDRAVADAQRVDELVTDGSVSKREQDQTRASLEQSRASLKQARAARLIAAQDIRTVTVGREALKAAVENSRAQLQLAKIDLEHSVIYAPENGQLSDVAVRTGQYVTNGTQLMFLVPPQPWIVANFKEAQTARMRLGQRVHFSVDALAGATLEGQLDKVAPAAGSEFTLLKPDNATGNFTKVPQRIAVWIRVLPNQPLGSRLRPGMSVLARVDTNSAQSP